jgi:hypothetical protein
MEWEYGLKLQSLVPSFQFIRFFHTFLYLCNSSHLAHLNSSSISQLLFSSIYLIILFFISMKFIVNSEWA